MSKAERSAILYKLPEEVCPHVRNFNSVTKINKIKMAAGRRSNATSPLNMYQKDAMWTFSHNQTIRFKQKVHPLKKPSLLSLLDT